jgi:hypothetical protein
LKRNPKTPSKPKPRTKLVRIDLTNEDQIRVNAIMSDQLRDPTRPGAERVSQKSAILHAVRAYTPGATEG